MHWYIYLPPPLFDPHEPSVEIVPPPAVVVEAEEEEEESEDVEPHDPKADWQPVPQ